MRFVANTLFALGLLIAFLWPRYFFLALAGKGVSAYAVFTPMLLALAIGLLLALPQWRRVPFAGLAHAPLVLGGLASYVAWRVIADLSGVNPGVSLATTGQSLLLDMSWVVIAAVLFSDDAMERAFPVLLTLVMVLATVAGLAEYLLQTPFQQLTGLSAHLAVDARMLKAIDAASSDPGQFRVKSVFSHPILYGLMMALMTPIALHMVRFGRVAGTIGGLVSLLSIALGIGMCQSRSPLIVVVVCTALYLTLDLCDFRRPGRLLTLFVLVIAGMLTAPIGVSAVADAVAGANTRDVKSSAARAVQYQRMDYALQARPVAGYGSGQATAYAGIEGRNQVVTLDSQFIVEAVDGGYVRLALYLLMFVCFALHGIGLILPERDSRARSMAAAMVAWVVGALVGFSIVVGDNMASVVYIAVGYLIAAAGRGALRDFARPQARRAGWIGRGPPCLLGYAPWFDPAD